MGELTFFLGLQVKQKEDGIFISQDKYVAEILKKFEFANVKTASTPIETQKPLVKDEEASDVDVHLYRSMIGSLMYLTASRPDIMFAVCACSRFQVTPKSSHLSAVKRIFRYLKGKPKLGLWYPRVSSFDLESYSDSDYAGANLDRKSTTGGCQFLGRRLISWQCKKQTIVATSTTEAEYVAAASCCGQVLWIQNQMLDYGFNFMNTKIYIDNESTICIVKNPVYHSKTKHIAIRHHFIRDAYEKKLIQVLKIHTDDNVADLLTKAFDVSSKMAVLDSCSKHNMVAYLEKFEGNADFHEIIDFLKRSSIHHALTSVSISEASIRSDLLFDDADGIDSLPNQTIFDAIQQMGKVFSFMVKKGKHFSGKVTPLFATMLVQPTQDEGASSGRPSEALPTPSPAPTSEIPLEPQPDSSPAQTSEVPIEHQPNLSPRPSPTPNILDSNLDCAHLGGQLAKFAADWRLQQMSSYRRFLKMYQLVMATPAMFRPLNLQWTSLLPHEDTQLLPFSAAVTTRRSKYGGPSKCFPEIVTARQTLKDWKVAQLEHVSAGQQSQYISFHAESWLPGGSVVMECLAEIKDVDSSGEIMLLTWSSSESEKLSCL
ncbi:hypothetical protein Tco_0184115 [Tanacetum coccineum]